MNEKIMVRHVDCICSSLEHIMRMFYFGNLEKGDTDYVYSTLLINSFPWHKRVWYAIKYIFGHQSVYGSSQECLWDVEKAKEIINFLQGYIAEEERAKKP